MDEKTKDEFLEEHKEALFEEQNVDQSEPDLEKEEKLKDYGEELFVEETIINNSKPDEYIQKSNMKWTFGRVLALVLIAALAGGAGFGLGTNFSPKDVVQTSANYDSFAKTLRLSTAFNTDQMDAVSVAEKVSPSVVAITSTVEVQDFFRTMTTEGQGSGVIYKIEDNKILIVTNHHVIENAKEVVVEFSDGSSATAQLIGSDPETDIALISIDLTAVSEKSMSAIKPIEIGDSDVLLVGESVMAVGNALGYGRTVTTGVVSALNRELPLMNGKMKLVQTDAAINPGNSGGALVNSTGQLIGINTIKIADTKVEGIGFALPINEVLRIADQLDKDGYISRPYLGIYGKNIDDTLSNLYELPIGVVVMEIVEGSGASASDLQTGDVIIKFDDVKITNMDDLVKAVETKTVGDKVSLTVVRDDEKKVIDITLTEKNTN
ncbi:MAG: serine protease [Clostridia bacterium]|nr:serine protease [Clostridia bacterium]